MLINLSNHPSHSWTDQQAAQALDVYGSVKDLPFPLVDPTLSEDQVQVLVDEFVAQCMALLPGNYDDSAIHVMGEMTFTVAFVIRMLEQGVPCIASTTERIVKELPDGVRETQFHFVRFRKYVL